MAAGSTYAGTCFVKVDGVQLRLDGDWKVQPNRIERTGTAGPSGVLGNTEKYVVPHIEGTMADGAGVSVTDLVNIVDSTVTLETRSGKVYILNNAWWAGESMIDAIEGKIPARFEGLGCTELQS